VKAGSRCTRAAGHAVYRARYYNPYICRFINADPSGFAGGLNFYAFCNDNPISLEDPFGTDPAFSPGIGIFQGLTAQQTVQASQTAAPFVGGLVVGATGAGAAAAGAAGLVALGVPASTVSGGLLVVGASGLVASGVSIYNNPSFNNISFNVGGLGGGLLVGSLSANYVASALSPPGYQPSGASIASLAWKDANGNINPFAFLADWLLPGAKVGPMSTGPDTSGATGTVAGAGAGVAGATDWLGNPLTSSSTGKH
jgi:RHS repeat-associated protein